MKNYLLYAMALFLVFSMGSAFAQDENNMIGIEENTEIIEEELIAEEALPDPTIDDSIATLEIWSQHEKDLERIPADEAAVPEDSTFLVVLPNAGDPPVIKAAIAWTGNGDGFGWNDPLNWDLNQVPSNVDDVTIGSGNSVQLIDGADGQCLSLTLGGNLVVGLKTLTVGGNISIQSGGSLYLSGTIYLTGNWSNSGTFAANSGSFVRLNGAGSQSIDATNFYHLNLENAGTKTATGDLNVDGSFRIYPGVTFDPASYDVNIAANFENDGTLTLGTGTITMDGTVTQTIYSNEAGAAPGIWNFNNLIIAGSVGSVILYDEISVNGDVNVNGGRFLYLRHYALTTPSEGIINGNGGTFTLGVNSRLYIRTRRTNGVGSTDDNFPSGFNTVNLVDGTNTSIVYYQSNSDQIIRSEDGDGDQIVYGRIVFGEENSGNYPTKTPDGALDINGYLNIGTNTTLDVTSSGHTLNVGGYWYNYATFTPRGGEVILDGITQQITGNNSTTFTNLTIAGSGAKTLYQTTTVNASCVVSAGVSYLNLRDEVLSGGGSSSFDLGANVILYVRATSNFPSFNSYTLRPDFDRKI